MAVAWQLGLAPDIGGNALAAFEHGRQVREQTDNRNALIDLQRQQETRLQQQQDQAQAQQRRADLPLMERLLNFAKDEPTYQQARQIAGQYGVDVSTLPPSFDPAWRDQQLGLVQALNTPHGQEALSTAGKIATDNGLQPGTEEFQKFVHDYTVASLARPYTGAQGETRLYTPEIGGPGQVMGAQPFDPNEWEVVGQGGGGGDAPGGFQP